MKSLYNLLIVALAALAVGCQDRNKGTQFYDEFAKETQMGVYVKGENTFIFNDLNHQLATNSKRNMYRFQTHEQDVYIHMELSKSAPSIKQSLTIAVTSKGIEDLPSGNYSVVVNKKQTVSSSELMWLWCEESQVGFVLPENY